MSTNFAGDALVIEPNVREAVKDVSVLSAVIAWRMMHGGQKTRLAEE